ncbi:dTDP-glucose 4,6-dehydratase [Murinocardiopsis flavida]|uniref:dTDP-glucose 4,6-dehydratase n=1 Tax=Murinocardiopsis flavida TaxID=645275 RepID=A0A2P8DTK1_9ACTN|nr:dTDP-glucose 4,6-dehydratase [Murinocardiopsis flavida]PSL00529.1 dTDP-glucose 4,6-dehydratase [Murinocardiopsis flavida]
MRILITGGAGFIGSNFASRVVHGFYPAFSGAHVTVLDCLTYAGSLSNLREIDQGDHFRFIRGDICDEDGVRDAMAGVDLVVHFAAESHVDRAILSAEEFVRTNLVGTRVLLDAALHCGVGRFVNVSTDEVYGSTRTGAFRESDQLDPSSAYSASKAGADLLALSYYKTHGLDVCVTRCTNNYGPYQNPEKLIPLFLTNLMEGEQVPLYGDGSNVRNWLYVSDHCDALAMVAASGRSGEVYNIGGGTEVSNRELTEMIIGLMGADWTKVRRVQDRKGHDFRYSVDSTKISLELGYTPKVSLPEGLAQTAQWYKNNGEWWSESKRRNQTASK